MARSPLTLAAFVSAAVPGAEAVSAKTLTTHSAGRNDSAVVTLGDGREVAVRLPLEESTAAELATEAVALRALTAGARALVSFEIPEFLGAAATPLGRVFVTTFVSGYQVDTAHIPVGRGVATSLGTTLAQLHGLPISVVRNAGLPMRTAADIRAELESLVEEASSTGRVPVRLMVRWREAVSNEALWQFEPTVTLGGANALAFVYADLNEVPTVVGVIDWHGLSVADPAIDLQFMQTAPEAAAIVFDSYHEAAHRAGDEYLLVRSRLYAELEFARWLLHGRDTDDEAVMNDAGAMLDTLAENVRDDAPLPTADRIGVDDAMAAVRNVPMPGRVVDTSMHTDTYDPHELALSGVSLSGAEEETRGATGSASLATQAIGERETMNLEEPAADTKVDTGPALASLMDEGPHPFGLTPLAADDPDATQPLDEEALAVAELTEGEAQRAARAAINRWKVDPSA